MADLAPKNNKTIPFPLIDYLSFGSFSDSLSSFHNDSSSTILRSYLPSFMTMVRLNCAASAGVPEAL